MVEQILQICLAPKFSTSTCVHLGFLSLPPLVGLAGGVGEGSRLIFSSLKTSDYIHKFGCLLGFFPISESG